METNTNAGEEVLCLFYISHRFDILDFFLKILHSIAIVFFFNKFCIFAYLPGSFHSLNLNICLCHPLFQKDSVTSWTNPCDHVRSEGMHASESTRSNVSHAQQMCFVFVFYSYELVLHSSVGLVCATSTTMNSVNIKPFSGPALMWSVLS